MNMNNDGFWGSWKEREDAYQDRLLESFPEEDFCDNPEVAATVTQDVLKQGIGDILGTAMGTGARYNAGKPDMSLIPLCTLEDEARVWDYGKKKYAAFNWSRGMPWSVPFACAIRHLGAWQRGEENDLESGLPHLAHAMCNLRMLTLYSRTYKDGDDRPTAFFKDWT